MAKYIYPAVFSTEGSGYSVFFPDLEGCYTCGDDLRDAIEMAEDVLAFYLYDFEKNKRTIPPASNPNDIQKSGNDFVSCILCDTIEYHKRNNKKTVKRMISLPAWLDDLAKENRISLSKVVQESLSEKFCCSI